MAFFDALGTGLGLELAAGVGIVVVGVALRNQVRSWFVAKPPSDFDSRLAQYRAEKATATATATTNPVAELILHSKPSDWENSHPNMTQEQKSYAMIDYWHHKQTKLVLRSKYELGDKNRDYCWYYIARVQEPTASVYSADVTYPKVEQDLIDHAWDCLMTRRKNSIEARQRKAIEDLLKDSAE